jgi:transcriptional regulator with XRE-family HTH domain
VEEVLQMTNNPLAMKIRAKKLGLLIRDARQFSGKSVEDCAQAIGVTAEVFVDYESGERSPSLPEIEALAYYQNVPLDHFWGDKTLSPTLGPKNQVNLAQVVGLRQRVIGLMIRKARLESGFSLESVAEKAALSTERLEAYELGEAPVPLPDLEVLCGILNRPVQDFFDQHGIVGVWANEQRSVQSFLALSPEMQAFISKPVNLPYLELAQRLSEMSVEKLRSVAEGLLEITY